MKDKRIVRVGVVGGGAIMKTACLSRVLFCQTVEQTLALGREPV